MLILTGLVMLGLGVVLMFVGRPRRGEMAAFLTVPSVEITYALLVTVLIGIGAMTTLGGLVGLFLPGISN